MKLVDRAYIEINGVQLPLEVTDTDHDPSAKEVEAMTRDGAHLGWAFGNPKYTVTGDVPLDADQTDIDLLQTCADKTPITVMIEYEGADAWNYTEGLILKASRKSGTGKHVVDSISCGFRYADKA
jgi:hypothetical protein